MALGKTLRDARLRKKMTTSQVAAATRMKVQIVEAIEREDFSKVSAAIYGKGFLKLYAECVGIDAKPLIAEYVESFAASTKPSLLGEEIQAAREAAVVQAGTAPMSESLPTDDQVGVDGETDIPRRRDILFEDLERSVRGERIQDFDPDAIAADGNGVFSSRKTLQIIKFASIAIGAVVVLVFLISASTRWFKNSSETVRTIEVTPTTSTTQPIPVAAGVKAEKKVATKPEQNVPKKQAPTPGKVRPVVDPPPPYVD